MCFVFLAPHSSPQSYSPCPNVVSEILPWSYIMTQSSGLSQLIKKLTSFQI